MQGEGERNHSRGYLPHVVKAGASYFVTFRLADSLPVEALAKLEEEMRRRFATAINGGSEAQVNWRRERRKEMELYLDRGAGACWLGNARIADAASGAVRVFDGERYELWEWVVMPNHMHLVVRPVNGWSLSRVLQGMKWKVAREANRILGLTGERFWQPESFDRVIRNEEEMRKVRRYIQSNPVKAGLYQTEEEWRWGSAWTGWK